MMKMKKKDLWLILKVCSLFIIIGILNSQCKGQDTRPRSVLENRLPIFFKNYSTQMFNPKLKIRLTTISVQYGKEYLNISFLQKPATQNPRESEIFYVERSDIWMGTVSFAKTPYVLLQLQMGGVKTDSFTQLKEPDKPYILRQVDSKGEIFQEQTTKLVEMFEFLDRHFKNSDIDKLLDLDLNDVRDKLLFPVPVEWFWLRSEELVLIPAPQQRTAGFYLTDYSVICQPH